MHPWGGRAVAFKVNVFSTLHSSTDPNVKFQVFLFKLYA